MCICFQALERAPLAQLCLRNKPRDHASYGRPLTYLSTVGMGGSQVPGLAAAASPRQQAGAAQSLGRRQRLPSRLLPDRGPRRRAAGSSDRYRRRPGQREVGPLQQGATSCSTLPRPHGLLTGSAECSTRIPRGLTISPLVAPLTLCRYCTLVQYFLPVIWSR